MKVGLYDPYLDTLGGGEKYILTIASLLSKEHDVVLFWDNLSIFEDASKRFHLDLSHVQVVKNIFSSGSLFTKWKQTRQFERFIYMSDGSIPFLFAKKNFLIFQFPVMWVNGKSFLNSLKLRNIETLICYSDFVKSYLEKTFSTRVIVLAPSIDSPQKVKQKKENTILTVGRFTKGMNTKKQKEMIEAFKTLVDAGLENWKFVLAGGMLEGDCDFVESLKKMIKGYPIEIYENVPYDKLLNLYKKSKIYWHAAGFGEDLAKYPERAEHFGITTVEAMSYGLVPVVFRGGGQGDIVTAQTGYTWKTKEELLAQTRLLMKDLTLWTSMSEKASERAKEFGNTVFAQKVKEIFL